MNFDNLIAILQKCRKERSLAYAKRVYAHICDNGLESHKVVGNYIVPMFVECGSLFDAQQVFNRLVHRNEHSWTSLILGYVECGEPQHALTLYRKMQQDTVHPSSYTLMALLKACARLKDLAKGRGIHAEITQQAFGSNCFLGNAVVDMYAKCGSLVDACKVFDKLPVRDVVSWNVLIAGYAEHGADQEGLQCFQQMQLEGTSPNAVTYVCILKSCGSLGTIGRGREIHNDISQKGFEKDVCVGNTVIDMYVKCGSIADAQDVFDKLPVQDVVSWTALIAGYVEHGPGQDALQCFQQMQVEGTAPNAVTFVSVLKACGNLGEVDQGREIHLHIATKGFERDVFVGSTLVDMYAKCGSLAEAQEVFDKLLIRNVVSWNALIAGYAEHGYGEEALKCFAQMQLQAVSPDAVTYASILKACGSIGAIEKGREVHADISQKEFERDVFVWNTLVDMYAKCGSVLETREVFDQLQSRDVMSWNALIAGYADHGPGQEAMKCFEQMQLEGVSPTALTFVRLLKACCRIGAIDMGQKIHAMINCEGYEGDVVVGNALVDMYGRHGSFVEAWEVFDKLPVRDVVSWTALIAGYAQHGPYHEALKCYKQMQLEGISPNAVTFVCVLKACVIIGSIDQGRQIQADIAQMGYETDVFVGSTLVDMFSKCGSLAEAREVFDKLPVRNVVSWTALIAGYVEHGPGQEVLKCFEQMLLEGVPPDASTFVCVLKACGSIGALDKGREMHACIRQKEFKRDGFVGSTLVDMYATCGSLLEAREVFDKLSVHDVVSWSAMIKGYGMNHEGNMAVQCFDDMQQQGVKPDEVTFTCLLTACSRSRLVIKGQQFFNVMRDKYGIAPTIDHYACMVDLLARTGHLFEAEKFLETMPCPPMWTALLSACKVHGELELGLRCFKQLVQMKPDYASPYVLMGKIYANADRWDDTYRLEELRKNAGAIKKPASALIEVNKEVHEFVVGNNKSKEMSAMLDILSSRMKEEGHVPNVNMIMRPISEEEKEAALCVRRELAIDFGLLNMPQRSCV